MAIPSLAMIPTGFKDGKLYSVLPESGAGDFSVTRGSGATRVNKDGLIEDVRILSGELVTNGGFDTDSDWVKGSNWTISNNKATSDGTNDTYISQNIAGLDLSKTYKVEVTCTNYTSGDLLPKIGSSGFETFITSQGSFTYYGSFGTDGRIRFYSSSFIGSIDNISVKEITEDTDIPRLDYTDGGCPVLLTEPQSTNLITYSEDFSDASWSKSNASVTSGFSSPDGANNAFNLNISISSGYLLTQLFSYSAVLGQSITASIFAKNEITNFLSFGGATVSGTDIYSIQDYGNGWFRHIVTRTFTTTATGGVQSIIYDQVGDNVIWGAQLEELPYSTSYIPTSGAIATRLADSVSGAGDATTFNSTEGVLYAEIAALADDLSTKRLSISDGTNNNRVMIGYSSLNRFQFVISDGGSVVLNQLISVSDTTQFNKVAISYKLNNCAIWINGQKVGVDTSATMPIGMSSFNFNQGSSSENFYGKTKTIAVFSEALTDEELTCLTTI